MAERSESSIVFQPTLPELEDEATSSYIEASVTVKGYRLLETMLTDKSSSSLARLCKHSMIECDVLQPFIVTEASMSTRSLLLEVR